MTRYTYRQVKKKSLKALKTGLPNAEPDAVAASTEKGAEGAVKGLSLGPGEQYMGESEFIHSGRIGSGGGSGGGDNRWSGDVQDGSSDDDCYVGYGGDVLGDRDARL